ncbi:MAG: type IV pilus biogenesis protein PilM [Hydrogenovibrio crunogenus]|nr:type IV pilus biogenesis protein PilM [Hydrogenovibrio crunogenus]
MLPIVMLVLISSLTYVATSDYQASIKEDIRQVDSDVKAVSFLSYREGVIRYHNSNPAVTGSVPQAALQPYFPFGYSDPGTWNNVITSNGLFVYSDSYIDVDRLKERLNRSLTLGRKSNSGYLISFSGLNTQIPLPAAIPVNAVVIVGS